MKIEKLKRLLPQSHTSAVYETILETAFFCIRYKEYLYVISYYSSTRLPKIAKSRSMLSSTATRG